MRLCVVTLHTPEMSVIANRTAINHREYCQKYHLDYLVHRGRLSTRHPAWDKIPLIRMILPFYDAILWIDCDCIFNNFHKQIPIIEQPGLFVRDPFYNGRNADVQLVNAGVFLLRNCSESIQFLDTVNEASMNVDSVEKRSYKGWPWEQGAICRELMKHPDRFIIRQDLDMNCHPTMASPETFIIHYMGWRTNQQTEDLALTDIDRRNLILLHGET